MHKNFKGLINRCGYYLMLFAQYIKSYFDSVLFAYLGGILYPRNVSEVHNLFVSSPPYILEETYTSSALHITILFETHHHTTKPNGN